MKKQQSEFQTTETVTASDKDDRQTTLEQHKASTKEESHVASKKQSFKEQDPLRSKAQSKQSEPVKPPPAAKASPRQAEAKQKNVQLSGSL